MTIVVLMGVSGCGKTTVGRLVAERMGWPFHDADDYHPAANVEKMRLGIPLRDRDRWPWLDRLNALLGEDQAHSASAVLACSALKESYRSRIARGIRDVRWVHLTGSYELIRGRIGQRHGHYMPVSLLESQFATLEPPRGALALDVTATPEELADAVCEMLRVPRPPET